MSEPSEGGGRNRWTTAATVVTNVAVLLGLGFVLVEIRQNEQEIAAQVHLALAASYQELSSRPIENPEFAATIVRAFTTPDSLGMVEFVQMQSWMHEWASVLQATRELRDAGAISRDKWLQHAQSFALFLDNEWFRDTFVRGFTASHGKDFVDELVALARSHDAE